MPWALVRMVCDVPFTVAVAVLMRFPELLAVGVVPPPPYLPPLYPLPLAVGGVFFEGPDPPVLLPQAVKRTTRGATTSAQHQARIFTCEGERLLSIMFPP